MVDWALKTNDLSNIYQKYAIIRYNCVKDKVVVVRMPNQ